MIYDIIVFLCETCIILIMYLCFNSDTITTSASISSLTGTSQALSIKAEDSCGKFSSSTLTIVIRNQVRPWRPGEGDWSMLVKPWPPFEGEGAVKRGKSFKKNWFNIQIPVITSLPTTYEIDETHTSSSLIHSLGVTDGEPISCTVTSTSPAGGPFTAKEITSGSGSRYLVNRSQNLLSP